VVAICPKETSSFIFSARDWTNAREATNPIIDSEFATTDLINLGPKESRVQHVKVKNSELLPSGITITIQMGGNEETIQRSEERGI
jgi:hypothetical protein